MKYASNWYFQSCSFPAAQKALDDVRGTAAVAGEETNLNFEYSFCERWKLFPPSTQTRSEFYWRVLTSSTFICSEKFMKNSSRSVSANKALHRMLLALSESINSEVIWIRGNVSENSLRTFPLSPPFLRRQGSQCTWARNFYPPKHS